MGCGSAGLRNLVPRFLCTWNQNSSFFHMGKFLSAAPNKAEIPKDWVSLGIEFTLDQTITG